MLRLTALILMFQLVCQQRTYAQNSSESLSNTDLIIMTITGFDFYKSDCITEGAKLNNPAILDTLTDFLNKFPELCVRLDFHAPCCCKSEEYYLDQTSLIAIMIKDILVSNGIDEDRLSTLGAGTSNPLFNCICGECPEYMMILNRRLKVVIIQ